MDMQRSTNKNPRESDSRNVRGLNPGHACERWHGQGWEQEAPAGGCSQLSMVLHLCSSISNASLNSRLLMEPLNACRTPGKPRRGMGISRVKGKEGKALFVFNLPDKSERF